MNMSSILAILSGIIVTVIGLYLSSSDMMLFVDTTSIFVVLGGTIAAAAVSVQTPKLLNLIKIFMTQTVKGRVVKYNDVIKELIELSSIFSNREKLAAKKDTIKDEFLKACVELYLDDLVDNDEDLIILTGIDGCYHIGNVVVLIILWAIQAMVLSYVGICVDGAQE